MKSYAHKYMSWFKEGNWRGGGPERSGSRSGGGRGRATIAAMFSLVFNLTRRFSPRGIPRAQAVLSPRIVPQATFVSRSGTPARSLYTLRDLEIVDGGGAAAAAAGLAAFVGLVGSLFFEERSNGSAGDVADKELPAKKPVTINEMSDKADETGKKFTYLCELPAKKPVTINERSDKADENGKKFTYLCGVYYTPAEMRVARYCEKMMKKDGN